MATRMEEHQQKLRCVRACMNTQTILRLREIDWFAWLLAGASNGVLLAAEKGIAEVFATPTELYVLTDEIEARRLRPEVLRH